MYPYRASPTCFIWSRNVSLWGFCSMNFCRADHTSGDSLVAQLTGTRSEMDNIQGFSRSKLLKSVSLSNVFTWFSIQKVLESTQQGTHPSCPLLLPSLPLSSVSCSSPF